VAHFQSNTVSRPSLVPMQIGGTHSRSEFISCVSFKIKQINNHLRFKYSLLGFNDPLIRSYAKECIVEFDSMVQS
jgi:hypothetical protein